MIRLRYGRRGWFVFWTKWLTGYTIFPSGKRIPDEFGAYEREIWVGPFNTMQEAVSALPDLRST